MIFKYANEVNFDFLTDVIALDAKIYPKTMQGTEKSIRSRFNANKDSFILAYKGTELVGYLCFFPITERLSRKIQEGKKAYDDNIAAEDILDSWTSDEAMDVFLISACVSKEHQNKGIGSQLMKRFFEFASCKIQTGSKIRNVFCSTYTSGGAALCVSSGFNIIKEINDTVTGGTVYLMSYNFDDFSKAKMYMFVPYFIGNQFDFDKLKSPDGDDASKEYISVMRETGGNEFSKTIANKLKRVFWGYERFILIDDGDKEILGERKCAVYFTYYNNFFIACLAFDDLGLDPTVLLSQASLNQLSVYNENGEKTDFCEYIRLKLGLEKNEIMQAGEVRTMTSLIQTPNEPHLAYMLACECYTKSYFTCRLISDEFFSKARRDIAQYSFSSIFASEKNVVYVLKEFHESRLFYESLMIFIMELLMLQLCAISSIYNEVMNALDHTKFSPHTLETVNIRFSRAAMLWDIDNFVFLTAKRLFETVSKEFGVPKLKEEYQDNLGIYEKLSVMKSQKESTKYSQTTARYFSFFSILSGISTLATLVGIFLGVPDLQSVLTIIAGSISIGIFIAAVSIRKFGFKKQTKVKRKKQKTEE